MTLETLVAHYGYPVIFVGAILEGETVLLIGAALVQQGFLEVKGLLMASALGAFVGDQFFFYLGRISKGNSFFKHQPAFQRKIDKAICLLERRLVLVVLSYRFIYGMRAVIPFLLGTGMIRAFIFTWLSAAGAVVWSAVIGAAGYYLGEVAQHLLDQGRAIQLWVGLAVLVLVLLGVGIHRWKSSRAGSAPPKTLHRR